MPEMPPPSNEKMAKYTLKSANCTRESFFGKKSAIISLFYMRLFFGDSYDWRNLD